MTQPLGAVTGKELIEVRKWALDHALATRQGNPLKSAAEYEAYLLRGDVPPLPSQGPH